LNPDLNDNTFASTVAPPFSAIVTTDGKALAVNNWNGVFTFDAL